MASNGAREEGGYIGKPLRRRAVYWEREGA